jgi:redox-sensitive bicupin YhaK (pirin superfamily)
MWHSEINNLEDKLMRFIQMWFLPSKHGLPPSVEQKSVEKSERTNIFLPLVSDYKPGSLRIVSDAEVYSCFLQKGHEAVHHIIKDRGAYLYVLEGGPVQVNGQITSALSAVMATNEKELSVRAEEDAELLLVDVLML